MLTAASAIVWLVEGFVRGGDGVHIEAQLPRVAQLTDVRGVGQFGRLSSNKWATVSHIAPGRYLGFRKTPKGIITSIRLILGQKFI